jgi:hypothetical protein
MTHAEAVDSSESDSGNHMAIVITIMCPDIAAICMVEASSQAS